MFYSGSQGMPWLDFDAMDDRLLGRCLRRQAEAIPDADFLVEDDVHYGFGRSNELANAYAAGFRELGVGRGDTVALFAKSGSELVFSALGLNKLGAIWVPTNTDYKGAWLRETFEDSRAKLLVADAELLPRVAELGELPFERIAVRGGEPEAELGVPILPLAALADRQGPEPDDSALYYGDTAAILWTSGTTGRSKGVMQSHNTWIKAALNGALTAGLQDGDVIYCCLPMYNSAAWVANVFRALVTGVPCGIDAQFSAGAFWDRTRHYGATMCFTLGAMHMFLWNAPERPDDADNPVRVFSAIPLPAPLEEPFKKRFGIESVFQGYGQSELMTVLARTPGEAWKPNSLGEPQAGVEVALLDDDDLPVTTAQPLVSQRRPDAAGRGRRVLLRGPQGGLHPLQGPQPVVVRGGGRGHGAPGGGPGGGARGDRRRAGERGRDEGLRGVQAGRARGRRGAGALRQRQRAPLLRAPLHRVPGGIAPDSHRPGPEVQAAGAGHHATDVGRPSSGVRDPALTPACAGFRPRNGRVIRRTRGIIRLRCVPAPTR
jgi:crotonobetaine/carnitine-CoA ligase